MEFLEQVPLAPYTTFQIGGPARWFAEAASEDDIAAGVAFAGEHQLPLFILGGGSNLLVSDAGFPGLVLRIALQRHRVETGERPLHLSLRRPEKTGTALLPTPWPRTLQVSSASLASPARWAARRCRMWAPMGKRFRKPS